MHTGVLILRGENDLSEVWKNLIEQVPQSMAFGNARQLDTSKFMEVQGESDMTEVLLTIHQHIKPEPYTYLIWSDEKHQIANISNRSSTIALWMEGGTTRKELELEPIRLLTRLNTTPSENEAPSQYLNYSELIKERVINKIVSPKYAMTMVYVGIVKPSFILATKKMMMYLWLVVVEDTYLLVWSTQSNLVNNMLMKLDQVRQHQVTIMPIDFPERSLLIVHPMYLISKINTHMKKLPAGRRQALSATYIKNYLSRMMTPVKPTIELS